MAYRLRGWLHFSSGLNGKLAYLESDGSFCKDKPITLAQDCYVELQFPVGRCLIFQIDINASNVVQANFGTRAQDGHEYGAFGAIEIEHVNSGNKYLYKVTKGTAYYSNPQIKFSVLTDDPVPA